MKKRGCYWCTHRVGLMCPLARTPLSVFVDTIEKLGELQDNEYYIGEDCTSFIDNKNVKDDEEKVIFT